MLLCFQQLDQLIFRHAASRECFGNWTADRAHRTRWRSHQLQLPSGVRLHIHTCRRRLCLQRSFGFGRDRYAQRHHWYDSKLGPAFKADSRRSIPVPAQVFHPAGRGPAVARVQWTFSHCVDSIIAVTTRSTAADPRTECTRKTTKSGLFSVALRAGPDSIATRQHLIEPSRRHHPLPSERCPSNSREIHAARGRRLASTLSRPSAMSEARVSPRFFA